MESVHGSSREQSQLLGVVRDVRTRYRLKLALRGAAIAIAAGWALIALGGVLMNAFHYADGVVMAVRIVAIASILGMVAWFIVRPLLPKLHDEQVALYLEENERSLNASVITAVEMQSGARAAALPSRSPALIDRLTRTALERVRLAGDGKAIDAGELKVNGGILAAVLGGAMLLTMFGPPALRNGLKLVAVPWHTDVASALFSISVEPGNATVAKGGDQMISANLRGFQSDHVELLVRAADSTTWTRVPMTADSNGVYAFRLFDIGSKTQYSVEANGIRSNTYTLDVSNLPFVRQIDLQYRYPAYTQLPPNDVDSTGDIAALKGTLVRVRVVPTVPTTGGRIIVEGGDTLKLVPTEDGKLMAMLRVNQPGFYKVELQGPDGRMVTGSLNYTIDVLPDRPPTVQFTKPGRDSKVLSVDEVYTEVRAQDDYGVAKVDLHFSVNGGPDQTMSLHDGTKAIKDISAGYTFMLEGLKLEPGDVVSYYAHATDNNAVTGAQGASTDIYFLQVRPYENDYRQQQGGGGGGGGGQQNDANQLSQTQREIIAATFKSARDSSQTDKKAFDENLATIRLSQQRLREQTSQLASRLVERGIAQGDSAWNKIAQILPKAAAEMDTAEKNLSKGSPTSALQPEQRALAQLQRAEAVFREIQVSMGGGGGGGGGGGNRTDAKDLADIFELQKDTLRNQYETVQRGQQQQQQQADNQVDETAEKLRQLAARQQQEDERARAKADSLSRMGQSGASGGQSQRDLAQQTEDQARKLERLAREQQNQSLADAARRLQDAADAMRRAAANGSKGAGDAAQADKALSDARRLLDQERNGRSSRDLSDAVKRAQQLADQEKKVQSDEQKLTQAQAGASGGSGSQQLKDLQQSIADQKAAMAEGVKDLKSQLDRMSNDSRRDQKELSRVLGGAADTLRGRKTEEKLRYSSGAARTAPAEWLNSTEPQIASDIADLGQRMQQAQTAAQNGTGQRQQAQAADKTRDLVRGLESMDERMRQRSEQNGATGAGQGADQGRRLQQGGQSGQQGQGQPQQGERGQGQAQGQQGQQGQGQAQGQQGQQGQGQAQGQQGQRGQAQGQQGQQGGQGQAQGQQGQQGQGQQGQQGQGQGQGQQGQQGQGGNGQGQNRGQQQANGGGIPGGRPGSQQNGGMGGPLNPNGVPGGGVPTGRLSPDDAQQFSREAQQRLADAQALRTELQRQGLATKELDQAIDNLKQLTNARALQDPRISTDLRAKTIEGFKDFEFGLRRRLGESDSTRVLLERSGDVPAAYKQNVEEYYRSIGKGKKP